MTKQEKIKEAYGKHWEIVKDYMTDDFGTCNNSKMQIGKEMEKNGIPIRWRFLKYFRPTSLDGIEDNNGWLNLPTKELLEQGFYFVKTRLPVTEYEEIFVHEIKDGAGIIPYHYAIQYKKIELKLSLY